MRVSWGSIMDDIEVGKGLRKVELGGNMALRWPLKAGIIVLCLFLYSMETTLTGPKRFWALGLAVAVLLGVIK